MPTQVRILHLPPEVKQGSDLRELKFAALSAYLKEVAGLANMGQYLVNRPVRPLTCGDASLVDVTFDVCVKYVSKSGPIGLRTAAHPSSPALTHGAGYRC